MAKYEVEDWQTGWNRANKGDEKVLTEYSATKLRNDEQYEAERLNKPGLVDKLLNWAMGKKKVAQKAAQEKGHEKTIVKKQQNTR